MRDHISRNLVKLIRKEAERILGRRLSELEKCNVEKPRSYMALEMILDHLKHGALDAEGARKYLSHL